MDSIIAALEALETSGDFFTQTTLSANALSIKVKNAGILHMPLSAKQIQEMINIAQPAKFGFKEQTLLDENVRKAWKVAKSYVGIHKRHFEDSMTPILEQIKTSLGLPKKASLTTELHDLLIYEPGGFFKVHQDSEKAEGMIATMVMLLPTEHEGGELVVSHKGKKHHFKKSATKGSKIDICAFYADCYHEVQPVLKGYRVAITFNLMLRNYSGSTSILKCTDKQKRLNQALEEHFHKNDGSPAKAVYLLDHQYTQASLSWQSLKSADAKRVEALLAAADSLGLDAYLALADVKENWLCEDDFDDYYYRSRRRYCTRCDEDGDFEPNPTYLNDTEVELKHWIDRKGAPFQIKSYSPNYKEVAWTGGNEDFEPFDSDFEGWMGNYGNTLDRWYHRAAIVLWKKTDHHAVFFELDMILYVSNLFKLSRSKKCQAEVKEMLNSILPYWSNYVSRNFEKKDENKVLLLAKMIEDENLSQQLLEHHELTLFNLTTLELWQKLEKQYGENWFLSTLSNLTKDSHCSYSTPSTKHLIDKLDNILFKLNSSKNFSTIIEYLADYQFNAIKSNHIQGKFTNDIHYQEEAINRCSDIASYIAALLAIRNKDKLKVCISQIKEQEKAYPPLEIVLTCNKYFKSMVQLINAKPFIEYLKNTILKEQKKGVRDKEDCSIEVQSSCSCYLCKELNEFLISSNEKEKIFSINQELRRHVSSEIDKLKQPVKHHTKRVGSPHKLVIEKDNSKLHLNATKRFNLVEKMMHVLTSLAI